MASEAYFRPAMHADTETLIGLMRRLYEYDHDVLNEARARGALAELLDQPAWGRVFVIEVATQTVGYLVLTFGYSLEFGGRDALVDELYLEADYRGQGIGTQALQFAEQVCRGEGVTALHLEVDRANTRAQGVYRSYGFTDHHRYLMTKWVETTRQPVGGPG